MATREKIREGLGSVIRKHNIHKHCMELPGYPLLLADLLDDILKKLHSQGVVIKVDRELPDNPYERETES